MVDLAVSEVFGPTIQGEGPGIGEPAVFLRLAGCNLACSWCDTPYSWDWKRYDRTEQVHRMSPGQVVDQIDTLRRKTSDPFGTCVVITGGEPLLQQDRLGPVIEPLSGATWFDVETAGTIVPNDTLFYYIRRFVVSPKLDHSGNPLPKRRVPAALDALRETGRAFWKFVVQDPSDFGELDDIVKVHRIDPGRVYVMPEGRTVEQIAKHTAAVAQATIDRGYNLTTRLQVLAWGDERGH